VTRPVAFGKANARAGLVRAIIQKWTDRELSSHPAQLRSKETNIGRRLIKMIMAAIDVSDWRCRQFVGIDAVEQWNLDCVERAHGFELAARRRANATNFAEVKLNRRPSAPRRRPLIVRLGFGARDETKAIGLRKYQPGTSLAAA
jgi:hypothetical protein